MRKQLKKPIYLRNTALGGQKPLLCIPIVDKDDFSLFQNAERAINLSADIIEWRADYYDNVLDIDKVHNALKILRDIANETPIIFTLRDKVEGGYREMAPDNRYNIIEQVAYTKQVDVIDCELIFGEDNIKKIKSFTSKLNITFILSYHNFVETPSIDFLIDKIKEQVLQGADIAKISVMPKKREDVFNLLFATLEARKKFSSIPLITVSMGKLGEISRKIGGFYGSDLTFGSDVGLSAPGQIPAKKLKTIIDLLYV